MPKILDETKRKEQIAEAVWSIATKNGLHSATVRAVATECGLSVGAIQHSFSSQAQLQQFSMSLLVERAKARIADLAVYRGGDPREKATLLLNQLLPLDEERLLEARVWAIFSALALTDCELSAYSLEMSELIGSLCHNCLSFLSEHGFIRHDAELSLEASLLQAILDGLTLRVLANPVPEKIIEAEQALRLHLRLLQG